MNKDQTKELEGIGEGGLPEKIEYKVTSFGALEQIRIAIKIGKTFSGGLSEALKGGIKDAMDQDVGALVENLLDNLDEKETPELFARILAKTERNGVHLTGEAIDKIYSGNFKELFEALKFSLEVNYGGFLSALTQAGIGDAMKSTKDQSEK